jgi:hypothetical protein
LIEANTNPCIEEPNTLLRSYVPRMIDDMLRIVLDPLFGTQVAADQKIFYPVKDYQDDDNMWKLIY